MITTVSPVNICHHSYKKNFFLVMRTFKIHSPNYFQISNTILTIVTMLYITSARIYSFYNWKFVPFDPPSPSMGENSWPYVAKSSVKLGISLGEGWDRRGGGPVPGSSQSEEQEEVVPLYSVALCCFSFPSPLSPPQGAQFRISYYTILSRRWCGSRGEVKGGQIEGKPEQVSQGTNSTASSK